MSAVFLILAVQVLLGAFDNLWHHELTARLPLRPSARFELLLHAAREAIYGVVFLGLAWLQWHGAFALLLTLILLAEICITIADFLEEDKSRRLPPLERALHTVLAIGFGLLLAVIAPVLVDWVRLPSELKLQSYGAISILFTFASIGVLFFSVRNLLAARRLGADLRTAAQMATASKPNGPLVLVTGATGFIGTALTRGLIADGHRVCVLTRDVLQGRLLFGRAAWVIDRLDDIPRETSIDAIVHLAGAPILGVPWSRRRRRVLIESRTGISTQLVALMRRLNHAPRVLISASAVGFYGTPDQSVRLDEASPPSSGQFQSDLCVAVEHEARRAEAIGVRVVRLRFGIVLGRDGGAYPGFALAARWGMGAVLGSGRQLVPWIHRDDAVGLIRFALQRDDVCGALNAVAPEQVEQAQFTRTIAASFGRRVLVRLPAAPFRLFMGEMSELLFDGQRVLPELARTKGYRFCFAELAAALDDLAQHPRDTASRRPVSMTR